MDVESFLAARLAVAFAVVVGEPVDPVVRRSQHADFQSDGALSVARRLNRAPRDVAADVVQAADLDGVCSAVTVSGPGFINLVVADGLLGSMLGGMAGHDRLGIPVSPAPETVVVDYSAPNVAKEMHVGHLRSTVIGDAVCGCWNGSATG